MAEKQGAKLHALEEAISSRKAMTAAGPGGVVDWEQYAQLKAENAELEGHVKELEMDVDEDAAAIQQLEQVSYRRTL